MRILFIVGSYPPDVCGVGDYTACLVRALRDAGIEVSVLTGQNWGLDGIWKLVRNVNSHNADIVHLQYPTLGFGYKLGPHLLAILTSLVLTVHEVSQSRLLRRLSLIAFSFRSKRFIFTTEYEKKYSERRCPWIKNRSSLVAIGSNISVSIIPPDEKQFIVGHFGLIRSNKGLEDVLELARLFSISKSAFTIRIMGKIMPGFEGYYADLRSKSLGLPIEWCIDMPDIRLAELIGECRFAYLPFPDGASERRASLIALMQAGACIMTTHGDQTPSFLERSVLFTRTPAQAFDSIQRLANEPELRSELQANAIEVAERYKWPQIAQSHIDLYRKLLTK